ncbi:MAG TPA: hypothetical protein VEK08_24740, partial [Planctomycetota bacterium]|nr:hypothetical protein [Planctomycetota bacterium]
TVVDIAGDTLTARMIDKHGEQRDTFTLIKQGKVVPQRIESPRQLEKFVPLPEPKPKEPEKKKKVLDLDDHDDDDHD